MTVSPLSEEDGGGYLIEFPDLPGCMSDGETHLQRDRAPQYDLDQLALTNSRRVRSVPVALRDPPAVESRDGNDTGRKRPEL